MPKNVREVTLVEIKKGSQSEAPFMEVDGTVMFCTNIKPYKTHYPQADINTAAVFQLKNWL